LINVSFFYTAFPGIPGRCVFGLGRELFSCCRFCLILADYVADEDADKNNCSDVAGNAVDNIDEVTETEQTSADHAENGQSNDCDPVLCGFLIGSDLAAEAPHHRASGGVDREDDHYNEDALSNRSEQAGQSEVRNLSGADDIEVAEDCEHDDRNCCVEEDNAEYRCCGGGLFVNCACAHGRKSRGKGHHCEAGVCDTAQPPSGRSLAELHSGKNSVNVAEVCLGKSNNANDYGEQCDERSDRADDIGELAQAEPNGDDGSCGHQACADKGIPVEVLVKSGAGAVEHDQIAAADENGAEPVENFTGYLAKVVGKNVVLVGFGNFLAFVEQLFGEQEVDDQRNCYSSGSTGDTVCNEE